MVATRCKTHANLNAMVSRDCWYIYDFLGRNHTMMVNLPGWCRTAWHSDEPSSNPTSLGLIPLPHCKVLKITITCILRRVILAHHTVQFNPPKNFLNPLMIFAQCSSCALGSESRNQGSLCKGSHRQQNLYNLVSVRLSDAVLGEASTLYKTWSQSVSWMLS